MSEITYSIVNSKDIENWNLFVDQSLGGTILHKWEWLIIAAKQTKSRLIPLVFHKGHSRICQLPLFLSSKFGFRVLSSYPLGGSIPYSGPIFLLEDCKQSTKEKIMKDVVKKINQFVDDIKRINYFRIVLKDSQDVRPFTWNGFDALACYTYEIDLTRDLNDIMKSFSPSTRRYLKKNLVDDRLEVTRGNLEDALRINRLVMERYVEQGIRYDVSDSYLLDIYNNFSDKVYVFVLKENGKFKTGIILLKINDSLAHWIGATRSESKTRGIVPLLHWHAIILGKKEGIKNYDLVGANTEHLCINKSTLNPDLVLYFILSRSNIFGRIYELLYYKFKGF